ncbi:hypothetical protein HY489_00400 [Candidatus Woesearchaeota archaeon]|nr:hypothetical protein [Candidatus Woesearchaeota archaeon]
MAREYKDEFTGLNVSVGYMLEGRQIGSISPLNPSDQLAARAFVDAFYRVAGDRGADCFVGTRVDDTPRMREILIGRAGVDAVYHDVVSLRLRIDAKGYVAEPALLFGKQRKEVSGRLEEMTDRLVGFLRNPASEKAPTKKASRARIAALSDSGYEGIDF